jgi:hypothetical protein
MLCFATCPGPLVIYLLITPLLPSFTTQMTDTSHYFQWLNPGRSWIILVPLLVGFEGLVAFHVYEASSWCSNTTSPPRLFGNRTAAVAFLRTFLTGALTFWRLYFMALYVEGVLLVSTGRSGVLLPRQY